jgi:hypothetical protein
MRKIHLSSLIALLASASSHSATLGTENCRVILPASVQVADESAEWQGTCADGYAEGNGVLLRSVKKKQIGSFEGRMARGMMAEGYEEAPDGAKYEGQYQDGLRHGKGVAVYKNGVHYDGTWRTGKRDGRGVATYPLGARYDGSWQDDQPTRDGKITFAGGQRTGDAKDYVPPVSPDSNGEKFRIREHNLNSIDRFPSDLAYGNSVPFDKGYTQMTPEQQYRFRTQYDFLYPEDVPPYPEKGTAEIFRWLSKAHANVRAYGDFRAIVNIDASGRAVAINVFSSPDEKITDVIKLLLANQKFTPAQCSGKPCAMPFPFYVSFTPAQ